MFKAVPKFLMVWVLADFFFLGFLVPSETSSITKTKFFSTVQSSESCLWWLTSTLTFLRYWRIESLKLAVIKYLDHNEKMCFQSLNFLRLKHIVVKGNDHEHFSTITGKENWPHQDLACPSSGSLASQHAQEIPSLWDGQVPTSAPKWPRKTCWPQRPTSDLLNRMWLRLLPWWYRARTKVSGVTNIIPSTDIQILTWREKKTIPTEWQWYSTTKAHSHHATRHCHRRTWGDWWFVT